jgi:hypothetical protein
MGKRGPRPLDRQTLALRGSKLAKHRPDSSGQYDQEAVEVPPGLSDGAGKLFASIQAKLISMACWDSLFKFPLTRYVELWEFWIKAISRKVVRESDLSKINTAMMALEKVLYLNPTDRKNLPGPEPKPDSDKMRFFGGNKPRLSS